VLAAQISGILGCAVVAVFSWWLGLLLLVMWLLVRRSMLVAVVRQATELRGQTTSMRRAWYFIAVGSKVRDAKEMRVFGLTGFVGQRFQSENLGAIQVGQSGLRELHRRAALCWVLVLAGYAVALLVIADAARDHTIDLRSLAILIPMLAVTTSTGSISFDDITLVWTLAGLPDVERLEPPGPMTWSGSFRAGWPPRSAVLSPVATVCPAASGRSLRWDGQCGAGIRFWWSLDEPTASLDARSEHALFERYAAAAKDAPRPAAP
jgi:ABC-type transport system involved in cytochrome bd biosynthesis fused ATPase/permease subunit